MVPPVIAAGCAPWHTVDVADLPTVSTWYSTAWGRLRGLFVAPPAAEKQVVAGATFVAGSPTGQDYDPHTALSSAAAFPWIRACVDAISDDLSGLPWAVYRGRGSSAVRLDAHPALDLLASPTSWQTSVEWERQVWLYLLLTGNAYAVMVGPSRRPSAMPLLFPAKTTIRPTAWGAPAAYVNHETGDEWAADIVCHWRLSSWQDSAEAVFGEGLIRALHNDLNADLSASKLSAKAASRWRPDAIISPKDDGDSWDEPVRRAVAAAYEAQIQRGGALVLSGAANVIHPDMKPRDLEYEGQRVLTRETVLAAFGVPPARVGLPTANYATQQQQAVTYWQKLVAQDRLFSARLTRVLSARYGEDITIAKDFSGVPELQTSRTERLGRVVTMVQQLGADAAEAAAYEGMPDMPVGVTAEAEAEVETPQRARTLTLLRGPSATLATDEARSEAWHEWQREIHGPHEERLSAALSAELDDQARRVAARLPAVWPARRAVNRDARATAHQRDIISAIMAAIWPVIEAMALGSVSQSILRTLLESAFGWSLRRMRLDPVVYDPSRLDTDVNASLGSLVTRVPETTREAVQAAVERGLSEGWTVREMQQALQALPQFGPARALAVARTETTRGANAGNEAAYQHAVSIGARVRTMWLTARDGEVREAHMALDGQVTGVGEVFTVPASPLVPAEYHGATARYPGDFAQAGLVVNCRCVCLPVRAA